MNDTAILDMITVTETKTAMQAKFSTMVQYFLEDSEQYINSIHEGIALASSEKIIPPAHTLKSSSKQMGAMRMSELAKSIEILAREQSSTTKIDMSAFAELITKLDEAFAETKTAYQQHAA